MSKKFKKFSTGSDAIVNLVIDLMTFGVEAISSTITWMVLYSLHHPEVQERIHREIDEVKQFLCF